MELGSSDLNLGLVACACQVRCKSDYPLSFFFRWRGFSSNAEVKDAQVGGY